MTVDREFKASTGWLEKFKPQHGIRNLSIQGEKLSAAEETVESFLRKLHKLIEEKNLILEQIYNVVYHKELLLPVAKKSKGSFNCAELYKYVQAV